MIAWPNPYSAPDLRATTLATLRADLAAALARAEAAEADVARLRAERDECRRHALRAEAAAAVGARAPVWRIP